MKVEEGSGDGTGETVSLEVKVPELYTLGEVRRQLTGKAVETEAESAEAREVRESVRRYGA